MLYNIRHYSLTTIDGLFADFDELRLNPCLILIDINRLRELRSDIFLNNDNLKEFMNEIVIGQILGFGQMNSIYRPFRKRGQKFYALEYSYEGPIDLRDFMINDIADNAIKAFNDLITSLRVLKLGVIGRFDALHLIEKLPSGLSVPYRSRTQVDYKGTAANLYNPYELSVDDLDILKVLFQKINLCKNDSIRKSLDRFNSIYGREKDEDKLIDIIVALEALYSVDIDSRIKPKSLMIAMRIGKHLGKDAIDEEKIKNSFLNAYQIRSQLIHDSKNSFSHPVIRKKIKESGWTGNIIMLHQLTDILRRAIFSILVDIGETEFYNKYLEKLDLSLSNLGEILY